jgi:maltooligosyltrehalose trehalohydrolase
LLPQQNRIEELDSLGSGYFGGTIDGVEHDTPYLYRLDEALERPDPASRLQVDGVHGPSRVVDLAYAWGDSTLRGVPLSQYVIYELHVGTFSRDGTFAGVSRDLPRLRNLGVTAVELMPVAQFPGRRNWGYDGAYPFAVQDSYGGPKELQKLVDECHRAGLSVILDVVYNHLGPEGNYLSDFGPYFTGSYQTPWGKAINFDGPGSDAVRNYFLQNALQWFEDFHIDALRLDAAHSIFDHSAVHFLEELATTIHNRALALGRYFYLIAESDLNAPRFVQPSSLGGYGLDSMWCDDFHHASHALLTGETAGYYVDYGTMSDLAKAYTTAMSRPGGYSAYRDKRYGRPDARLEAHQGVVCLQNHDQVGNRFHGERLSSLVSFEAEKLAAGLLCFAPYLPLLFMGQEYGERAPFLYWVDHGDESLLHAVRQGREREFMSFLGQSPIPDPGAPETFERCILAPTKGVREKGAALSRLYTRLLELRRSFKLSPGALAIAHERERVLFVQDDGCGVVLLFCLARCAVDISLPIKPGIWTKLVSSASAEWSGPGCNLPDRFESAGAKQLSLLPQSFVGYQLLD